MATMTTAGKNLHLYLDVSPNNVGPEHDYHLGTIFSSTPVEYSMLLLAKPDLTYVCSKTSNLQDAARSHYD
jgi:hypothetical protein